MSYAVKEIYYTLQGEGHHTGRPAVFLRFAGCNLWSGREEDRESAVCRFCDTDFFGTDGPGGGTFASAGELADRVLSVWETGVVLAVNGNPVASLSLALPRSSSPCNNGHPFVVCTGGEPLLQLNPPLVGALHDRDFEIAVETNGTVVPPPGIDWLCVSPKAGADLVVESGDELKLVFPQTEAMPAQYEHLSFRHFYLQPMDGPELAANTKAVVNFCLKNPGWKVSLQTHKILNIP